MPGKLADPENVLVDVGARYFVEKVSVDVLLAPDLLLLPRFWSKRLVPVVARPPLTPSSAATARLHACSQSVKDAKVFYNTKILNLRKSLDTLQPTIEQKNENRQVVIEFLQMKLSAREREAQQGAGAVKT